MLVDLGVETVPVDDELAHAAARVRAESTRSSRTPSPWRPPLRPRDVSPSAWRCSTST
jgi:hypothetical protein